MRKLLLILVLATGCASVPTDVVDSIGVLRDNTHKLAGNYRKLLNRSSAPKDDGAQSEEGRDRAWAKHKKYQKMLMSANNTLSDKVYEWAVVSSDKTDDIKETE